MHNAALRAMGLDTLYRYELMPMGSNELPGLVEAIRNQRITGANITIPYKTEIMRYLSTVEKESQTIGAINTIYSLNDGPVGCNTDVYGFRAAIKDHSVDVRNIRVSILGAGGAAKAIAYALADDGIVSIEILSRSKTRAAALVDMLRQNFDIPIRLLVTPSVVRKPLETDLVVYCTPVGMFGHSIMEVPLNTSLLTDDMTVMDLVYNPLKTLLLQDAERMGCRIIGGAEMLAHQGAASLRLWTGRAPPVAVMKQALFDILGVDSNE
jgi:shikimate dehydrogenase